MFVSHHFNVRKPLTLIIALMFGASFGVFAAKPKIKPPQISQEQKDIGFRQLFSNIFSQWDANQDGVLDLKELNAVIENSEVRSSEAAIAVVLHRRLQVDDEEKTNGLTLTEALTLADDPAVQKKTFPEKPGTSRPSITPCSLPPIRIWKRSIRAA